MPATSLISLERSLVVPYDFCKHDGSFDASRIEAEEKLDDAIVNNLKHAGDEYPFVVASILQEKLSHWLLNAEIEGAARDRIVTRFGVNNFLHLTAVRAGRAVLRHQAFSDHDYIHYNQDVMHAGIEGWDRIRG